MWEEMDILAGSEEYRECGWKPAVWDCGRDADDMSCERDRRDDSNSALFVTRYAARELSASVRVRKKAVSETRGIISSAGRALDGQGRARQERNEEEGLTWCRLL